MRIQDTLRSGSDRERRAIFSFDSSNDSHQIYVKFNLWARFFFGRYFKSPDAPFHEEIDKGNIDAYRYRGEEDGIDQFVDIAFRGAAKTARTKLFVAFAIANDLDHYRRFMRCLSEDLDNAKQSVTDVFNMLINPRVVAMYPEIWEKTDTKREETMSSFTTSSGVKLIAKQIGVDQRGKIQEDAKADFDWYDDFETKSSIRSVVLTHKIAENMEESRTGLALYGGSIYTCNYFSEMGNVHTLVKKKSKTKRVLIVPIEDAKGSPTWERYTKAVIASMREKDDDFEGERMCRPEKSKDLFFPRSRLDLQIPCQPIDDIAGFRIFHKYVPGHRYGSGHDVAGGVGLDSSTSVFIDFSTVPARVVATFADNMIQPEAFGNEIFSQGKRYALPIQGIENNKYDQAVLKAKDLGSYLYKTKGKELKLGYQKHTLYGWETNSLTKSKMLDALKSALVDGLLEIPDEDVVNELKSYTRNDLIESEPDPRLTTRHFDYVMALAIAWQMMPHAVAAHAKKDANDPWPAKGSRSEPKTNPAL